MQDSARSPHPNVRRIAVEAIGIHPQGARLASAIRTLLTDPSPVVVRSACEAAARQRVVDAHDRVRRRLDINVVRTVHVAGVAARRIEVGDGAAAVIVILELDLTRQGRSRSPVRRRYRRIAWPGIRCFRAGQGRRRGVQCSVELREIDAEILPVGTGSFGRARRHKMVIGSAGVDEVRLPRCDRGEIVAGRIPFGHAARQRVSQHNRVRAIGRQGNRALAVVAPEDAVGVGAQQIVRDLEPENARAGQRVAAVEEESAAAVVVDGVVIEGDVLRTATDDGQSPGGGIVRRGPLRVHVIQHVVPDGDVLRLLAHRQIVVAVDVERPGDVPDHVVLHDDVADDAPRRRSVLVARGEHDRVPLLAGRPVVLNRIAFEKDALRVLELDAILDRPRLRHPCRLLRDQVPPYGDVARHEIDNRRIAAAEHHVFARRFEVVVLDNEWTGSVPACNRLSILTDTLEIREIRVHDIGLAAVQRQATALTVHRIAVQVAAVHDQVVRGGRHRGLTRSGAPELHQVRTGGRRGGKKFEEQQAPVRGAAWRDPEGRSGICRPDFGQQRRIGRSDAFARRRQRGIGSGRTNGNVSAAALFPQFERAAERRAGLKQNRVARLRSVDRRLQVAASVHSYRGGCSRRAGSQQGERQTETGRPSVFQIAILLMGLNGFGVTVEQARLTPWTGCELFVGFSCGGN